MKPSELEEYFRPFRENTIGYQATFPFLYGESKILYADWIASGRLYRPIENAISHLVGPMMANTHSFSSETGKASTYAYRQARQIIKEHVNAGDEDILVAAATGMTGLLARLQRLMGIRHHESIRTKDDVKRTERPVVFITHMEHHSNQISWMETMADVVILSPDTNNLVNVDSLRSALEQYKERPLKIGAFTACSNVTGIVTPYHQMAKLMHQHNGYCIVDFAASAPYVEIDMNPIDDEERLDAVLFSPHKFLGGPGSCGILVFNKALYNSSIPDVPGGGNVKWTDPWGGYAYYDDIETKEDGGTPGILQTIRAAMAIKLKEEMSVEKMEKRELELLDLFFDHVQNINGVRILGDLDSQRIGCVSLMVDDIHYNLVVRLLNDRYGVQVRGGWSCASTYAHHLLCIDKEVSSQLTSNLKFKNLSTKPGWIRFSLHPTMTNEELTYSCNALKSIVENIDEWQKAYQYNPQTNEFDHFEHCDTSLKKNISTWFEFGFNQ